MPAKTDTNESLIDALLRSDEPSIRWKVRRDVLGDDPSSRSMRALGAEIKRSPRVAALLARRGADGRFANHHTVYDKWQGAHWVLAALADIGYPAGDRSLVPMRDQVMDFWLSDYYDMEFEARTKAEAYRREGVPVMQGRHRRCASQQGNALLFVTKLGLAEKRCNRLAERLLHWQWPDGGWNCDKDPAADTSSFMETLLPMRGLAAHGAHTGGPSIEAAQRAAEVFLERRLFRRRSDGAVIHPEFLALHYPLYWHYDILGGLVGMMEAGMLGDARCNDALDLLESKRLPDGWPAEKRYYSVSDTVKLGADFVDWGGTSSRHGNPWVTVTALAVLKAAGRIG